MSYPACEVKVGPGVLGLAPMRGRGGDLLSDLRQLLSWRPALVVSLTEPHEMPEARQALGELCEGAGVPWVALPIEDYGLPKGEGAILAEVDRHLRRGARVFVHCMGGCGRSGTVALRLMVMAGQGPEQAFADLRALRPCAVETEAQRLWAISL